FNPHFEGPCTRCPTERLAECTARNPLAPVFRACTPDYWSRLREVYFRKLERPDIRHVCPSESVGRNLCRLDARFERCKFVTLPHGSRTHCADAFGGATAERRLRVVVLGRLSPAKGLHLLRRAMPLMRLLADVHLLGCGEAGRTFIGLPGVHVVPDYVGHELSAHLLAIRPDVACFLSQVPETFSYTLSEAWAHGLPVCAPRLGSFADRVSEGRDGCFYDGAAEGLVAALLALDNDRARLVAMHEAVMQRGARSIGEMVSDYYLLRDDLTQVAAAYLAHRDPSNVGESAA
ncbi:MAG TPA: glycosyltransferase, partial [Myxococcota bacterium]|nr:glycosyltransferase [Myxococcota bacterium]